MVFYGGIVAQRKQGFQSSFRGQPGRRRRKALLPGNGQRKGCGPSFGSLPGGMGGYVPVGDEGSDGPADLAPTLGVYCLRRSEERSDAPQAQPPPSKFHFEIWDAGYGDPYLTSFRKGRCLYWPADRHSRCSRRGRALPRPVWRCGYSDDRVGADLCVRPLPPAGPKAPLWKGICHPQGGWGIIHRRLPAISQGPMRASAPLRGTAITPPYPGRLRRSRGRRGRRFPHKIFGFADHSPRRE